MFKTLLTRVIQLLLLGYILSILLEGKFEFAVSLLVLLYALTINENIERLIGGIVNEQSKEETKVQ